MTETARSGAGSFERWVVDELDGKHRAEPAHVTDLTPTSLPGEHPFADGSPIALARVDEVLVREDVHNGERSGECDRVADVGSPDGAEMWRVHELGLAITPESGSPAAIDFATMIRSASTA